MVEDLLTSRARTSINNNNNNDTNNNVLNVLWIIRDKSSAFHAKDSLNIYLLLSYINILKIFIEHQLWLMPRVTCLKRETCSLSS